MFRNRLAHRFAQLRIFGGKAKCAFGQADTTRRDVDAAKLQPTGRLKEALPLDTTNQVVGGDAVIIEDQLCTVDAVITELLELLASGETLLLGRDEKAHALVTRLGLRICLCQHCKTAALDPVRYPGFGAVEHIIVAIPHCRHTDRLQVGPGIGFSQCQPAANFAAGKFGKPFRLLRTCAEPLDGNGHN